MLTPRHRGYRRTHIVIHPECGCRSYETVDGKGKLVELKVQTCSVCLERAFDYLHTLPEQVQTTLFDKPS